MRISTLMLSFIRTLVCVAATFAPVFGANTAPTFSKAFDQASIFPGATATLTFNIVNPNPIPLTGLTFTDTLPAGLVVATPSGLTDTCNGATAGPNSISLTNGTVAANPGNCTISVSVLAITSGTQVNTTSTLTSNEAPAAAAATASIVVFTAFDGAFQLSYANDPRIGESYINIINTGAAGAPLQGPGFGATAGNTCVNVYTFDPGEELISCCSCLLTPNQVVNLGLIGSALVYKTLTGVVPNSAVVKLVNTLAGPTGTANSCTNSASLAGGAAFPLASGMVAYGTTPQNGGALLPAYNIVEHPFIPATLSPGELASITGRCTQIIGNGSGFGICLSCRAGALGAAKK